MRPNNINPAGCGQPGLLWHWQMWAWLLYYPSEQSFSTVEFFLFSGGVVASVICKASGIQSNNFME